MLFAVKNRLCPSLLLMASLAGCSFLLRTLLGIRWLLAPTPGVLSKAALGLSVIVASDGLIQATLWLGLGARYRVRYQALAAYFRPQGPLEIAGAGLLAGSEELLFRGVLLGGLMSRAELGPGVAIGLSALAFGAAHRLGDPRLAPFTLWAMWEGVLLGGVYVLFNSLLVSVLVHAAHDVIGFSLFAWQRRQQDLAPPPENSSL